MEVPGEKESTLDMIKQNSSNSNFLNKNKLLVFQKLLSSNPLIPMNQCLIQFFFNSCIVQQYNFCIKVIYQSCLLVS